METMFFIWFGICFVCYMSRTVFNVLNYKKNPLAQNKKIVTSIFIVMFVLWFSWFQMCFLEPIKMNIPDWIRYIGLSLFLMGVFLFIFSHTKLKGFEDTGELITGGIYSKIRNPMYLGFIIWIVGFPIFTKSLITLVSSTIWISHIIYWKILEERELEEKYKEYREYKKKTWF
ncbi:isoprenylcysteine carboxylmethyltransferase family protein [candidate division WOR-3 bacterium]|nr:isoprenylcysteine carboxylmethyltransferase family protein [candidate division WOR-3 bacterium]